MTIQRYLQEQQEFSLKTFGPGRRVKGLIQHIQKELVEIEQNPGDLSEWIDVIILALDGYWRNGGNYTTIMEDLFKKLEKNKNRNWPPPVSEHEAVEHIRE